MGGHSDKHIQQHPSLVPRSRARGDPLYIAHMAKIESGASRIAIDRGLPLVSGGGHSGKHIQQHPPWSPAIEVTPIAIAIAINREFGREALLHDAKLESGSSLVD